jgi:hypothetical protein
VNTRHWKKLDQILLLVQQLGGVALKLEQL